MSRTISRTYKLKLSDKGIGLFLDSHFRLCHLTRDLLSYGATLHTAIILLSSAPDDDLAADILRADIPSLGGGQIRYVGASQALSAVMGSLIKRIGEMGIVHPVPQAWKIFIAGLCSMQAAEDSELRRAYGNLPSRMDI